MISSFDQTDNVEWFVSDKSDVFAVTKKGDKYSKKPTKNKKRGYFYVRTTNGNYSLHRLVAVAFIPNPENKPEVNHKDGYKENNSVSNLEWVTRKENIQHAIRTGLIKQMNKNEGNLKYSNEQCKNILLRVAGGMSYHKAGSLYKMPYSTVAHLVKGSRRHII